MNIKSNVLVFAILATATFAAAFGASDTAYAREASEGPRREDRQFDRREDRQIDRREDRREDRAREIDDRGAAKRGTDDPPGDDRGGHGNDDPAGDDRGRGHRRGHGRSGRDHD